MSRLDWLASIELFEQGQTLLRADLQGLNEIPLDESRKTNWGELWPAWRVLWTMIDHDALHVGAIGHLRDLYYWTCR